MNKGVTNFHKSAVTLPELPKLFYETVIHNSGDPFPGMPALYSGFVIAIK